MSFIPNGPTTQLSLSGSAGTVSFTPKEGLAVRFYGNFNPVFVSFYGTATSSDMPLQLNAPSGNDSEIFKIPVDATTISVFGTGTVWATLGQLD
jgi:hypothetical protein